MKVSAVENKEISDKGIVSATVAHRGNIKLKTRLRLSDYIFREVDCGADKKKNAAKERMGSHSLSALYHFRSL